MDYWIPQIGTYMT